MLDECALGAVQATTTEVPELAVVGMLALPGTSLGVTTSSVEKLPYP